LYGVVILVQVDVGEEGVLYIYFKKKVIISYGKSNSVHVRIANTLRYAEITSKSLKI